MIAVERKKREKQKEKVNVLCVCKREDSISTSKG